MAISKDFLDKLPDVIVSYKEAFHVLKEALTYFYVKIDYETLLINN